LVKKIGKKARKREAKKSSIHATIKRIENTTWSDETLDRREKAARILDQLKTISTNTETNIELNHAIVKWSDKLNR